MLLIQAVFCSSERISFRPAERSDFLNSVLREKALTEFVDHELFIDEGSVLTDKRNQLKVWQIEGALKHWEVIRTVMADEIWINY